MTDAQLSVLLFQYASRLLELCETASLDRLRQFANEIKQDSEILEISARAVRDKPAVR